MSDSYKLLVDGTGTGNLYGLAWSHPNAGGVASNLNDHGLLVINNGVFAAAISSSIRAASDMRAPIFYDSADSTYYLDPNSTTSLRTVGSWRSDSSSWDGEYSGKIQYHSNHWYFQSGNLWIFRNAGGSNVFQVDQSGNGTFNGDIYLGTRATWLSSYLNQDVRTSASPSFSTVNLSTLNASDTNARYYVQSTNGVPSNNLGNPTVTEMALFDEQFNNKTAFYDNTALSFWTSSDGTNYTEYTGFDTTAKKRFLGGDSDSGVYIPNLTNRFRIELENTQGYVFLNQLYIYWSSNSHSTKVHIWVRRCDNNQWYQWTDSNTQVSSWPGHLYLPFSGIPFYPGALASTGHFNRIRIEFIPSWSSGTYSYTNINLMRMQIWGGYPAGKRNIYSTDENQNVSFPATLSATTFSGALSGNATTASALTSMNISQFTNNSGYITGYTETDTLASVTGRGGTATTPITISTGSSQPLSLTTANGSPWHLALNRTDLGLTSRVFAHNSPYNGWYFEHNISIAGNTNWHSGNLTNLNQLSNGPGYLTGITSGNVTTALGYTPYNATNPNGYITGISFASVSSKPTTISGYGITDAITTANIGSQSVSYAATAGSAPNAGNVNDFYNVTAGNGYGLKFWNSDNYKISMGVGALYQYGPVTDYSIKMQMNDSDAGRGFTWGRLSYAPIAALNSTSGDMEVAGYYKSYGYRSNSNVGGTGSASWHPDGIYCGSTMWQYGSLNKNNTGIYNVSEMTMNSGPTLSTYNTRNLIVRALDNNADVGILGQKSGGGFAFQIYGTGSSYGFLNGTWAAWDIRKAVSGAMYMNDNDSYYLQTNGTSNFYALNIQGNAVVHAGNIGSQSVSYATTAGSADQIDGRGFVNTGSNNATYADSINSNGISYVAYNISLLGQTDGALYSQAHDSAWQHQIYGDYRTGQIVVRGKLNGTWQAWRTVIDSSTIGSQSVSYASSAGSVAWTNVSSRPTALSQFTNDLGNYGGFLTSITAHSHAISDVTGLQTALDSKQASLGFTPYNSTNPSGYITSSGSISGNAATATTAPSGINRGDQIHGGSGVTPATSFASMPSGMSGFTDNWSGGDLPSGMGHVHGIACRHFNNTSNSWGWHMVGQYDQPGDLRVRWVNAGTWTAYYQLLSSSNYNSYSPTLTGTGASGTWGISITGNANTATSATSASTAGYSDEAKWISYPDGPRDLSDRLPNWNNRSVAWDFVGAGTANGSGNYGGVMTFSPWDGTSASTGDSSYQLAFANATGVNASGQPKLSIRNGINSTWNAWYTLVHSGNVGDQSVSYATTAGTANAVAWTNVSSRPTALSQFTNDLGNYGGWITGINSGNVTTALGFTPYNATNPSGYITSSASISGNAATATYATTAGSAPANGGNSTTVGGYTPSGSVGANTVVIRDANNYIYAHYINSNVSETENPTINSFYTSNGDGWLRKSSVAHVKSQLGLGSMAYESSGTYQTVSGAINTGNIASQSVSYATISQQLTKFGDIYGQDWNSYFITGKLIVSNSLGHTGANRPSDSYGYGTVLSYGETGGPLMQMYFPEDVGNTGGAYRALAYRSGYNGGWSPWKTVVNQVGNTCTVAGSNGTGLQVHSNVGYNQNPLTYFLLRGQADSSWKTFKILLTGDAGGQDIEFRRIAENNTDARMFYVPRGLNQVIFDYTVVQPSDSRLKDNLTPITNPVDKIKSLRGVEFDWNSGEHVGTHDVGLIAQDVEAVLPEAVTTQEDGYKNLAYTKVIPLLVEAMKEQQTMIEALRAEIELLKNK